MAYERFDEITLDDNKTYIVVDSVIYNDITYVYLTNESDDNKYLIVKVILENDKIYFDDVSDEEFKIISDIIREKNKDLIEDILEREV